MTMEPSRLPPLYLPSFERWFDLGEDKKIIDELKRIRQEDPLIEYVDDLLAYMRGNTSFPSLPSLPDEHSNDRLFLEQIGKLGTNKEVDNFFSDNQRHRFLKKSGPEYDFLDQDCRKPWSIAKLFNFILLSRVKANYRSAVVATMRNDGVTVLEFVAHYRALGFDHIFVFSNDNEDGTAEMLELLSRHEIVTFINNPISHNVSPQRKAFEYSLHFLPELRQFEWVFYADSDEFLLPAPEFSFKISSVLDAASTAHTDFIPSAVCYHWKWFGGHSFKRKPGLQLEKYRFCRSNSLVKSIVRLNDVQSMWPLHYPICKGAPLFVNSALELDRTLQTPNSVAKYNGGAIYHYWHKSFQEFFVKLSRGEKLNIDELKNEYKRSYHQYFLWNVPSTEQHRNDAPELAINLVRTELESLLALTGVRELNESIEIGFDKFIASIIDLKWLHATYEEFTLGFPHLGMEMISQ